MQTNEEGGQVNSHTIDAFIQSIVEDTTPVCDGAEGRASLNVIMKAIESAETNIITRI